jgi:WD40 repeat protein
VEVQLRKKAQLQERVLQTQTKSQPNRHSAVSDALKVMKEAAADKDMIDSPAAEGLLRSAMAGIGWEELPLPRKPLACAQSDSAPHARPEENPVTAAEFSPMGKWLAVGRRDGAVVVWAMDSRGGLSPQPLTRYGNCTNGRSAEVSALSFGPDDSDLAIGFGDGRFVIVKPNAPDTDLQPQPPKLHESAVREIVFSSDSKWFTTVALDGTSLLWARKGVQKIMDLSTIKDSVVTSLTFTPFPRRMHFGTTDGKIHSLNLLSSPPALDAPRLIAKDIANKPVAALAVHPSARMTAIAWSGGYTGFRTLSMDPNSKMVHEVIEVIGAANPGTQDERAPQVSSVASLEFSDDGRWLVSRTRDHQMQLWAVTNEFRLRFQETFPEPGLPLESVQFGSIQGILRRTRWLLGEVGDGTVLLWDLMEPRNVPLALRGHKGPLTVACFDPRGRWLLTSCFDGTNRLWDLERLEDPSRSVEPRVVLDDAPVLAGRFSTARNQHRFATITNRGKLRAWDLDHSKDQSILVPESRPPIDPVYRPRVAFSGDGNLLFLTIATYLGEPPLSKVWRPGDPRTSDRRIPVEAMFPENGSKRPEEQFFLSRYELGADGRFLAGSDLEGNPVVVDLPAPHSVDVDLLAPNEADRLRIPVSHAIAQGGGTLGFSPAGNQLMMAGPNIGVKLWNLQFPERKAVLSGEASFPWQTPQTPLPGAAADEPSKGNEPSGIIAVAVSNDGKWLAAAGQGVVWVWERSSSSTFAPPIVLRGHTGALSALVFTPDGEKLISGSDDSTVRVWHLKPTPKVDAFVPLLGHSGPITSVSVSPDGKLLLTTSLDGTARVWTLNREMLIDRAEQMTLEPEMARVRARY